MSQWEARMSELVHYDAADQVVTLTLDSPHNRNALSRQLVAELTGRLAEASAEPSARAIVITHTGRVFCAGADLAEAGSQSIPGMAPPATPVPAETRGRKFPDVWELGRFR
jgi:enoyl-CoA hydratase/carnithine racemase